MVAMQGNTSAGRETLPHPPRVAADDANSEELPPAADGRNRPPRLGGRRLRRQSHDEQILLRRPRPGGRPRDAKELPSGPDRDHGPARPGYDPKDRQGADQLVLPGRPPAARRARLRAPAEQLIDALPTHAVVLGQLHNGRRFGLLSEFGECRRGEPAGPAALAAVGAILNHNDLAAEPVDNLRLGVTTHGLPFGPPA